MATVDFKKVPTVVPLTAENIDRLTARATELATAFQARIAKIQQQVADARDRFSREAEEVVRETEPANRTVARQFAKQQEASRIAKFRLTIAESSRAQREELLRPFVLRTGFDVPEVFEDGFSPVQLKALTLLSPGGDLKIECTAMQASQQRSVHELLKEQLPGPLEGNWVVTAAQVNLY